ncbi:hypothetical protein [Pseudomonas farsensis]|uniref:Uncharacterized protein n=1 Tax=Pseudomonas farsensis TaxID=2745492 RepID=A0ABU8QLY1_9PSED
MDEQDGKDPANRIKGFLSIGNVRDLALIGLITVVCYRLATAKIDIELKDFSFTDLLSMFLAVSAIALSAAFYFKADESARSFYNNTYKFTKDVSESLGRIDAGFGEKLKNIDQSYVGISDKLDRFTDPLYMASKAKAAKEVEDKEADIQEQEARRDDVLQELMRRADMAGAEKEQTLAKLAEMSEELARSKAELERSRSLSVDWGSPMVSKFLSLIYKYYEKRYMGAPPIVILRHFSDVMKDKDFTPGLRSYLIDAGFMDGGGLTPRGVDLVRQMLERRVDF